MEDKEFLGSNFPACMKKEDLIAKLSESQGVVERKSRRDLVNELETLLLFSFRGERRLPLLIHKDSGRILEGLFILIAREEQ